MMTGKTLIHAVCEDVKNYPHLCEIPFFLYDEKDRLNIDSDVTFSDDLFAENSEERTRFIEYLNQLEKKNIPYIEARISESHVITFSKTADLEIFSRKQRS